MIGNPKYDNFINLLPANDQQISDCALKGPLHNTSISMQYMMNGRWHNAMISKGPDSSCLYMHITTKHQNHIVCERFEMHPVSFNHTFQAQASTLALCQRYMPILDQMMRLLNQHNVPSELSSFQCYMYDDILCHMSSYKTVDHLQTSAVYVKGDCHSLAYQYEPFTLHWDKATCMTHSNHAASLHLGDWISTVHCAYANDSRHYLILDVMSLTTGASLMLDTSSINIKSDEVQKVLDIAQIILKKLQQHGEAWHYLYHLDHALRDVKEIIIC